MEAVHFPGQIHASVLEGLSPSELLLIFFLSVIVQASLFAVGVSGLVPCSFCHPPA